MTLKQGDWRWCSKCGGLVYFGSAPCSAGGVHDHSQSGDYSLRFDGGQGQSNWRWCKKCQSLSFTGNTNIGPCPRSGTHDTSDSVDYTLTIDQDGGPGQHYWRWCNKCQGLFWAGGSSLGKCQAGGDHDPSGGANYTLSLNGNPAGGQGQWRLCNKCMLLAYDGYASCAGGGSHINAGSGYYTLTGNDPKAPGQDNWRWCNKCYGIAYAGSASLGACPRAGVHNHSGSSNYVLRQGNYPGAQDHWSWCNKCQLLWYRGNGKTRCPEGPDPYHNDSGSENYALDHQLAGLQTASVPILGIPSGTLSPSNISGTKDAPARSGRAIGAGAIAAIVIGFAIACVIAVWVVLLLRKSRSQQRRAIAEAVAGLHDASTTKLPANSAADVHSRKLSVAATAAPSNVVEVDRQKRHETSTDAPASSPRASGNIEAAAGQSSTEW